MRHIGKVELDRALSKLGYASRADARRLIEAGRVRVNGRIATNPAALVVPETVRIQIDDVDRKRARWTLLALNKPRGVVTTKRDPEGRKTVYDVLGDAALGLVPVGRLDLASTGLLLFTNDTQLANWLTDPGSGIIRKYVVTVRGELADDRARRLVDGMQLDGERLAAASVHILKRSKRETHLIVELDEGKNREIRRMLKAAGHEVTRLKRIAFGGIELGNLAPGTWRDVPMTEARRAFPGVLNAYISVDMAERS